jgi:CubicO group peptidase (beta-lactamase class C family)
VGIAVKGRPVREQAYGMADLEHGVKNRPDTIFEAGSVSKQFTAAAVLLLAREGKLALDDPARKYVPELPDYGAPLTIRHMLQHTSGLRDWGEVASLAGWPRTTRVHTHAHVLDIVSRQRALNFPPGTQWSYSNTGYNLAVVIVARVSAKPFAEFTRERIFEPMGMTRTSWRDDFTRVVKDRAVAYVERGGRFQQDMPFENVHGNGGLLTTVGDLLKWNENAVAQKVGDAEFLRIQHDPGRFTDGTPHTYAMGLTIGDYRGVKEVGHSGSTAGYRAHLVRYPDQHVSVAVLCNVSSGGATQAAQAVSDIYLAGHVKPAAAGGRGRGRGGAGQKTPAPVLTAEQLAAYAGTYVSDEAETTFTVVADGSGLTLKRRPDVSIPLTATGPDTFDARFAAMRFIRDADGRVTELSVAGSRVFDMRFKKQ